MTKPHEPFAPRQLLSNKRLSFPFFADIKYELERRTWRAAVQRSLERADCAGDCGNEVGTLKLNMTQKPFLTAKEAADRLGITLATLYAYVSRGLIRSEEADSQRRTRKYAAVDVETLLEKKRLRQDPARAAEAAAQTALDWGRPVLPSAITRIADGAFFYRGKDACDLAQTHSFEQICGVLWVDDATKTAVYPTVSLPIFPTDTPNLRPIDRIQAALPLMAASDLSGFDLNGTAVAKTGQTILSLMLSIVCQKETAHSSAAKALQKTWRPDLPSLAPLLDLALCLCADHELNVSAFTVRTVASAGSTPYAAINAGLSALQGAMHGGHTERVRALLREVGQPNAAEKISMRCSLPYFGQRASTLRLTSL